MIKAILILVALGVGFGGGVYFAHHNPEAAAKLSAEEEKKFLEAQLAITQKIKAKLEQLSAADNAVKPPGGSGFISSKQAAAATPQDVKELHSQTDAQEAMLRQRLEKLK
jgi:hypothetical protein